MTHLNPLSDLPTELGAVAKALVEEVARVPGVEAIALGGSYARGTARADSDVDLGVYYSERRPLSVVAVRALVDRFAPTEIATVTALYEWGPWVNGGAWIQTAAGKVDLLYRNIDQVERVIEAARRGELEWHFGQQPPYGFHAVIYLAETHTCRPVHDPHDVLGPLKRALDSYPRQLREAIVREYLWSTEFTLFHGRHFAARGDVYNAVGCLTRAVSLLTQVLFALNETYFITDKGALEAIDAFACRPAGYSGEVCALLARPGATAVELGATMQRLGALFSRVIALAPGLYQPKYRL